MSVRRGHVPRPRAGYEPQRQRRAREDGRTPAERKMASTRTKKGRGAEFKESGPALDEPLTCLRGCFTGPTSPRATEEMFLLSRVRFEPAANSAERAVIACLLGKVNRLRRSLPGDRDHRPLRFGMLKWLTACSRTLVRGTPGTAPDPDTRLASSRSGNTSRTRTGFSRWRWQTAGIELEGLG